MSVFISSFSNFANCLAFSTAIFFKSSSSSRILLYLSSFSFSCFSSSCFCFSSLILPRPCKILNEFYEALAKKLPTRVFIIFSSNDRGMEGGPGTDSGNRCMTPQRDFFLAISLLAARFRARLPFRALTCHAKGKRRMDL